MGNKKLSAGIRRETVKTMIVRGYTQQEISGTLEVSIATIERDVAAIREATMKEAKEPADRAFSDFIMQMDEIYAENWKLYERHSTPEGDPRIALKCLDGAMKTVYARARILFELGILEKRPLDQRIEISWKETSEERIKQMYEERFGKPFTLERLREVYEQVHGKKEPTT